MLKCVTCGGTYNPTAADGSRYFHACAPIVDPKTGATSARPNARNENAPPPAVLAAQLAGVTDNNASNYWPARNAVSDAAITSAGGGVVQV